MRRYEVKMRVRFANTQIYDAYMISEKIKRGREIRKIRGITVIGKETEIYMPRKVPPYLSGYYENKEIIKSYYNNSMKIHKIFKNAHEYRYMEEEKEKEKNIEKNRRKYKKIRENVDKKIKKGYKEKIPIFDTNLEINEIDLPYLIKNPYKEKKIKERYKETKRRI